MLKAVVVEMVKSQGLDSKKSMYFRWELIGNPTHVYRMIPR